MSNELLRRLDVILENDSGEKIVEMADELKQTIEEYLAINSYICMSPSKGLAEPIDTPEGLSGFKESVSNGSANATQISAMTKSFVKIGAQAGANLSRVLNHEVSNIDALVNLSNLLSVTIKEEADEAMGELQWIKKNCKMDFDSADDIAAERWGKYSKLKMSMSNKLTEKVPPKALKLAEKLVEGKKLKLSDVSIEDLKAVQDTPMGKQIILRFGQ